MLSIGPYTHPSRVVVAPMAGVTDRPFRNLCRAEGSHWIVSEMVTSDMSLWHTNKSRHRLAHHDEPGIRWVQLAGAEADMLAEAARANASLGAQIIDINMGCPAKKVCNKAAGSALLRDEALVGDILAAVVGALEPLGVPVTLKIRLGWSREEMNAIRIAQIAQAAGVQLLTVHGRTRACRFKGEVDYEAIGQVKAAVDIPVIANGDITSPAGAKAVLDVTGADGVMIGRAAQGKPWLPGQIDTFLRTGRHGSDPSVEAIALKLRTHVQTLHSFYGEYQGLRIARKHVGWTLDHLARGNDMKARFNRTTCAKEQLHIIDELHARARAA